MSKVKILLISSEFPPGPGGIGKHAYDVARALSGQGYEVTVCASQDFSTAVEKEQFNRMLSGVFHIISFKRAGASTYYNRWKTINKYLQNEQPAKVIVTGRFSLWMGYLVKMKFGKSIPVHAFVHGSELSLKNNIYHILTKRSLRFIDHIWAVSSFTKSVIQKNVNRNDIKILPNGLWFDDWLLSEKIQENISLDGKPVLLTVGQLSLRKGQHRVLNVMREIMAIYPDVHYHMVGIPTDKERLQKLATAHQIDRNISFHGRIVSLDLLKKYYEASQIFIMLSENQQDGDAEGYGIAILEANYFGKPAIGAIGCGIEDAISDGYNGRLVDGNNSAQIIDAISDIMNHYEAYSFRAKQWADKHDWKELITRFEESKGMGEKEKNYFKS